MKFYHIVYRSENNLKFFKTDEDYISFWEMLLFCLDKYNAKILAAGLLTNHIHLFLKIREETLKKFLISLMARQRNYLFRAGRVKKGERATVRKGIFLQTYTTDNKKGLRANVLYVNRNYYRNDETIDIYTHPSSAVPLVLAALEGHDANSSNVFSRFLAWDKYYGRVDLRTLKMLFGNATDVFKKNFVEEIVSSEEDDEADSSSTVNELVETFLKQVPSVRFYKSKTEKLTHLSESDRISLVKHLLENGISNYLQIAKIVKVSNASVYRYLKKIRTE